MALTIALSSAACAGAREEGPAGARGSDATRRLWPVIVGTRFGFIDRTGKVVVPPRYGLASYFVEGRARVSTYPVLEALATGRQPPGVDGSRTRVGFIDATGREVVPVIYDLAGRFSEGLAVVAKDGKYGYVDLRGRVRIPLQFDEAERFSEGLAFVRDQRGRRFIDRSGKTVVDVDAVRCVVNGREHGISPGKFFSEGLVEFEATGAPTPNRRGLMDRAGRIAVDPRFEWVYGMLEGVAHVTLERADAIDRADALVDRTGAFAIPPEWSPNRRLSSMHEGLVRFSYANDAKTSGFLNARNELVFELKYDFACQWFSEGRCQVKRGGTWAYLDLTGREVFTLPPDTRHASFFREGFAAVQSRQGWRFVSRDGTILPDVLFADFAFFEGGLARIVLLDGREAYVDTQGRMVYRSAEPLEHRRAALPLE